MSEPSPTNATRSALPQNPVFVIALAACVGCMLLAFASLHQHRIVSWVVEDPDQMGTRLRALLFTLAVIGVVPVGLVSFFAGRMSMEVSRSGRYPPPGVRLRRREIVRHGPEADSAARGLRIACIVLGAITVAIPVLFCLFASSLMPA